MKSEIVKVVGHRKDAIFIRMAYLCRAFPPPFLSIGAHARPQASAWRHDSSQKAVDSGAMSRSHLSDLYPSHRRPSLWLISTHSQHWALFLTVSSYCLLVSLAHSLPHSDFLVFPYFRLHLKLSLGQISILILLEKQQFYRNTTKH